MEENPSDIKADKESTESKSNQPASEYWSE